MKLNEEASYGRSGRRNRPRTVKHVPGVDLALAQAINIIPEPALLVQSVGIIIAANYGAARLFRRISSKLVGCKLDNLFSNDAEITFRFVRRCLRTRVGISSRFCIKTSDEKPIVCQVSGGLATGKGRQPPLIWLRLSPSGMEDKHFSAHHERLTKRERIEDRYGEFEERFRLLIDCVQDYAIYMIDENGKVISWNAGAERIKGYSAEEVLGRHFSIFYSAADIERGKPLDQLRAATKAERIENEGWRIRKDGSLFWANAVITAIRDTNKNVIGFSTIIRDFDERKSAEENLRDTKERLQLTLNLAIDAIVTMDGDGIIAEWNMEAERIFG